MASLNASVSAGLKWVEIDVGITKDSIVIVNHFHTSLYEDCPADILRETKMVVSDTTYEVLCSQATKIGLPIPPKLDDVLSIFKGRLGFQIELKQDTNYKLASTCNKAAAYKVNDKQCEERSQEHDLLLHEVVASLERSRFPANHTIISSFEAARLNNFRRINSRYHNLKLVGGQAVGVDGMIKICQMYLGPTPHVALPIQFSTKERVLELQTQGIVVEIGLPSAGNCLSHSNIEQQPAEKIKKQITNALASKPNSICTDFPRDVIDQQSVHLR